MIQAFRSPEIRVRGVSVSFGNTDLERAVPIAKEIARRFGPTDLTVSAGAASSDELGQANDATRALIAELEQRELVVLALGPVTNVATVVRLRQDLCGKIRKIVVCAARRPGFGFYIPGRPDAVLPDANFEKDVPAMQVLLDSGIPIVFAGYEVSCDTWISRDDLARIARSGPGGEWIAQTSEAWITRWEKLRGPRGFNPFDTLCVAYVTHPELIELIHVSAHITTGPDDRAGTGLPATRPTKPYLIAEPANASDARHVYCTLAKPQFRDVLIERLCDPQESGR
jgi:pyrimidine-specific ribonucleoside hydrolase